MSNPAKRLAPVKTKPRGQHAALILRDYMLTHPWWTLGLSRERWRRTPFEARVALF